MSVTHKSDLSSWTIQKRDFPFDNPTRSTTVTCRNCPRAKRSLVASQWIGGKKRLVKKARPAGAILEQQSRNLANCKACSKSFSQTPCGQCRGGQGQIISAHISCARPRHSSSSGVGWTKVRVPVAMFEEFSSNAQANVPLTFHVRFPAVSGAYKR